jgi:hypothetical protein
VTQAEEFEQLRALLFAIAYQILGSVSEAEDAVQETWLRYEASPTHREMAHRCGNGARSRPPVGHGRGSGFALQGGPPVVQTPQHRQGAAGTVFGEWCDNQQLDRKRLFVLNRER